MKSFIRWKILWAAVFLLLVGGTISVTAQTSGFTYQGRLTDNAPQGGSYLLSFELYDAATGGSLIDTLTDVPATVTNGVFTVELNFTAANAFDGSERFLQISVRRNVSESYVTLNPRQKINSAPYAVRALTATNALQIDGTPASQIIREGDARLTDARQPLAGSGDYIQNQDATPQAASNFNIAGNGTVGGTLSGGVVNAARQFNIGGSRVFFIDLNGRTFAGKNAGRLNTTGAFISFFGESAGDQNTQGTHNAFFGSYAGRSNTTGYGNSFFGADAGFLNVTGIQNSFFGFRAGWSNTAAENSFFGTDAGFQNTSGTQNVFIGRDAGTGNTVGSNNTFLGFNARPTVNNLNFAAAIGSGATVSTSNTIVLGRSDGSDTVQIPGALNVSGVFGANILNAATQFNLGGQRVFFTPAGNTFVGIEAGRDNTTGDRNAFFGNFAGTSNTEGANNSFFGREAGNRNTTGGSNSFFGFAAGYFTTTGNFNSFFGSESGITNSTGIDNSFFGKQSGYTNTEGSRNTFFGATAGFGNQRGNNNTAIGFNADVGANLSNATAIGANAVVSTSNSLVLGNGVNVGIGTSSPDAKLQVNGGDIYVGTPGAGVILRSPNGGCFRLVVNNSGVLGTAAIACPQ